MKKLFDICFDRVKFLFLEDKILGLDKLPHDIYELFEEKVFKSLPVKLFNCQCNVHNPNNIKPYVSLHMNETNTEISYTISFKKFLQSHNFENSSALFFFNGIVKKINPWNENMSIKKFYPVVTKNPNICFVIY